MRGSAGTRRISSLTQQQQAALVCSQLRRRHWRPPLALLPGKSRGWRSLVGCSPWGRKESDMTERLHFHFSLSCFGEGNDNPLQCSCLENPRDSGAWWAAIYGVTQSRTRLKRLTSSSSQLGPPPLPTLLFSNEFLFRATPPNFLLSSIKECSPFILWTCLFVNHSLLVLKCDSTAMPE